MTTRLQQRRQRLQAEFGFDLPDDVYRLWDWVNRLAPLAPLTALQESLGVTLVGAFEVLAGRFDNRVPRHSLQLHWRYHDDPPEFFTLLYGLGDGQHWGWYLDDPATGVGCISCYFANDAYELSADGDDLFEALRLHLEYLVADGDQLSDDEATEWRQRLMEHATDDRPETGEEYTDLYAGYSERRAALVIAETSEGMGIVAPPERYRVLSLVDKKLWRRLQREDDPAAIVEEARQALRDGYPATALKLGKDLWATVGSQKTEYAYELLESAYAALDRPTLLRVLQTHRANRSLPSVDILENESEGVE